MGLIMENALNIVNGEISMIIAALKKNTKWSMLQHQDDINNQTLREFTKLKDILKDIKSINDIDQNTYFTPFLNTIVCEDTTGPVTRLALTSLQKFLQYHLIDIKQKNFCSTIDKIAYSLIHARFIGTDPSADEVVLQKILQVMQMLFFSPIGIYLNDQSVCGILHSFFRIAFETRLAELLRHFAENALTEIFFDILNRLKQLKARDIIDEAVIPNNLDSIEGNCINVGGPVNQTVSDSAYEDDIYTSNLSIIEKDGDFQEHDENFDFSDTDKMKNQMMNDKEFENRLVPYGLATINELLRFIITLTTPPQIIDKQNQASAEIKIIYSLNLLTIAFETKADDLLRYRFVMNFVRDRLCRNLIELLKSDKITVVASTLRLALFIFKSARRFLKYQMEMFFLKLIEIIGSEGVLYQKKEYILDTLVQLFKIPNFGTELYLNYDCDLYGSDVLEDCVKLLSKNAFPITGIYSIHVLSLEALFAIIDDISQRCNDALILTPQLPPPPPQSSSPTPQQQQPHLQLNPSMDSQLKRPGTNAAFSKHHYIEKSHQLASTSTSSSYSVTPPHLITTSDEEISTTTIRHPVPPGSDGMEIFPTNIIPPHNQNSCSTIKNISPLRQIKNEKKILLTGTEKFNSKPAKGIQYLKENGFFGSQLSNNEESTEKDAVNYSIARFLRENPYLDKKMVGDYLSTRKNLDVLKSFVNSFSFHRTRLDEALRMYLESFRLPGEAPLISLLLENFAHHWHVSNGEPFVNEDAAFALAYAIIMLNVDQHHQIVKKQMNPMSPEEFIKNLSKVNGGNDFEREMLLEIYHAIKSDEIIMPAEQTGVVKENYMWKVLLRRSDASSYGYFTNELDLIKHSSCHSPLIDGEDDGEIISANKNSPALPPPAAAPNSSCDPLIFEILWGPVLAASSYIFDKIPGILFYSGSEQHSFVPNNAAVVATGEALTNSAIRRDERIINKIMNAFKKSAVIANHFELPDVLDKLIITLCKFTNITNTNEPLENIPVLLGNSYKAMTALKTCFIFVRYHGDTLKEGWRYFIELMFHLLKIGLLPPSFMELDDYLSLNGKIPLVRYLREHFYYPDTRTQTNYRTRFYFPHRYFHVTRNVGMAAFGNNKPALYNYGINTTINKNSFHPPYLGNSNFGLSMSSYLNSPSSGGGNSGYWTSTNTSSSKEYALYFDPYQADYNPYMFSRSNANSSSTGLLSSVYNYFASTTGLGSVAAPNQARHKITNVCKLKTYKNGYPYYYYNRANPFAIKKERRHHSSSANNHSAKRSELPQFLSTTDEDNNNLENKDTINRTERYKIKTKDKSLKSVLFNPDYTFLLFGAIKEYNEAERVAIENARVCVDTECQPSNLIFDSKFLKIDSLRELLKTLMYRVDYHYDYDTDRSTTDVVNNKTIDSPVVVKNSDISSPTRFESGIEVTEDQLIFNLELLIRIVIQNRDRIQFIWPCVRSYFYEIIVNKANSLLDLPTISHQTGGFNPIWNDKSDSTTLIDNTNTISRELSRESFTNPTAPDIVSVPPIDYPSFNTAENIRPGKFTTNATSKLSVGNKMKRPASFISSKKKNQIAAQASANRTSSSMVMISYEFLLERAVEGLFHMATRLLRKTDMVIRIIGSLRILLLFSDGVDGPFSMDPSRFSSRSSSFRGTFLGRKSHHNNDSSSKVSNLVSPDNNKSNKKGSGDRGCDIASGIGVNEDRGAGTKDNINDNNYYSNYFASRLSPHCSLGMADLIKLNMNILYKSLGAKDWAVIFSCLERIGCSIQASVKTVCSDINDLFLSADTEETAENHQATTNNNLCGTTTSDTELCRNSSRKVVAANNNLEFKIMADNNLPNYQNVNKSLEEWLFVQQIDDSSIDDGIGTNNAKPALSDTVLNIAPQQRISNISHDYYEENKVVHLVEISVKPHNPFSFVKCCQILSNLLNVHSSSGVGHHSLTLDNYFLAQTTLLAFVDIYVTGKRINETAKRGSINNSRNGNGINRARSSNIKTVTQFLFSCRSSAASASAAAVADSHETAAAYSEETNLMINDSFGILNFYGSKKTSSNSSGHPYLPDTISQSMTNATDENNILRGDPEHENEGGQDYYLSSCYSEESRDEAADDFDDSTTSGDGRGDDDAHQPTTTDDETDEFGCPPNESADDDNNKEHPQLKKTSKDVTQKRPPPKSSSDKYGEVFLLLLEMIFALRESSQEILYVVEKFHHPADTAATTVKQFDKLHWLRTFLWPYVWKPLLGGVCKLCLDRRRHVRLTSMTYLQRALLVTDFQEHLTQNEWINVFVEILFPLINKILDKDSRHGSNSKEFSASASLPVTATAGKKSSAHHLNQDQLESSGGKTKQQPLGSSRFHSLSNSRQYLEEESKHRLCTLMCKIFLQRLSVLFKAPPPPENGGGGVSSNPPCASWHDPLFARIWLRLLDFMEKFLRSATITHHNTGLQQPQPVFGSPSHLNNFQQSSYNLASTNTSDMLVEAIPESLKNMLLVMDTSGLFTIDSKLKDLTWQRINLFLPKILLEIRLQQEQMNPPRPAKEIPPHPNQGIQMTELASAVSEINNYGDRKNNNNDSALPPPVNQYILHVLPPRGSSVSNPCDDDDPSPYDKNIAPHMLLQTKLTDYQQHQQKQQLFTTRSDIDFEDSNYSTTSSGSATTLKPNDSNLGYATSNLPNIMGEESKKQLLPNEFAKVVTSDNINPLSKII